MAENHEGKAKYPKRLTRMSGRVPITLHTLSGGIQLVSNLFLHRYPVTSPIPWKHFFIVGSGRSGNTLLRAILTSNNDIAIPPESYVLPAIYRKYHLYRAMPWRDLASMVISSFESHPEFYTWEVNLAPAYEKAVSLRPLDRSLSRIIHEVYETYAHQVFPSATVWGDKTPMNSTYIRWIAKMFPEAFYIHIIRDGKDVASSYLKEGLRETIEDSCWTWNNSVNNILDFKETLPEDRYTEIRYEDLVSTPDKEIRRLCGFLGITYTKSMIDRNNAAGRLGDVSSHSHHRNVKKPISKKNIGKWKKNLSKEQQAYVLKTLGPNLERLGYGQS